MEIQQAFRCPNCGIVAYVLELPERPAQKKNIENVGSCIRLHHDLYHKVDVLTGEHFMNGTVE